MANLFSLFLRTTIYFVVVTSMLYASRFPSLEIPQTNILSCPANETVSDKPI